MRPDFEQIVDGWQNCQDWRMLAERIEHAARWGESHGFNATEARVMEYMASQMNSVKV